jgi:hypothetical protein
VRFGDASRASRGAPLGRAGDHVRHLTVAELRSGDPKACTPLSSGISRGQVSERRSPAAAAPAARPGEVIVSLALDDMTVKQVRELTWGDPCHPHGAGNGERSADQAGNSDVDYGVVAPMTLQTTPNPELAGAH